MCVSLSSKSGGLVKASHYGKNVFCVTYIENHSHLCYDKTSSGTAINQIVIGNCITEVKGSVNLVHFTKVLYLRLQSKKAGTHGKPAVCFNHVNPNGNDDRNLN